MKYAHIHIYTIIFYRLAPLVASQFRSRSTFENFSILLKQIERFCRAGSSRIDAEAGRRRAGAEALNEPQQLHGLTVRHRATTATYGPRVRYAGPRGNTLSVFSARPPDIGVLCEALPPGATRFSVICIC